MKILEAPLLKWSGSHWKCSCIPLDKNRSTTGGQSGLPYLQLWPQQQDSPDHANSTGISVTLYFGSDPNIFLLPPPRSRSTQSTYELLSPDFVKLKDISYTWCLTCNDVQVQQFSSPSQVQVRVPFHQVKSKSVLLKNWPSQVKSTSQVKSISSNLTNLSIRWIGVPWIHLCQYPKKTPIFG